MITCLYSTGSVMFGFHWLSWTWPAWKGRLNRFQESVSKHNIVFIYLYLFIYEDLSQQNRQKQLSLSFWTQNSIKMIIIDADKNTVAMSWLLQSRVSCKLWSYCGYWLWWLLFYYVKCLETKISRNFNYQKFVSSCVPVLIKTFYASILKFSKLVTILPKRGMILTC